jgi:hypothetical protein
LTFELLMSVYSANVSFESQCVSAAGCPSKRLSQLLGFEKKEVPCASVNFTPREPVKQPAVLSKRKLTTQPSLPPDPKRQTFFSPIKASKPKVLKAARSPQAPNPFSERSAQLVF